MPRAVDGTRRSDRRRKILKLAKGFKSRRKNIFRTAKDAVRKSLQYAYRDRRQKKRDFRRLWITRLSAALTPHAISYSRFIHGLKLANVALDRLALSNMAIEDQTAFSEVVKVAKKSLGVNV